MSIITNSARENSKIVAKPFLRWAGGKRRIVTHLIDRMPSKKIGHYWEPFLGSGALFFAISPEKAVLSDVNSELISCYKFLAKDPDLVFRYLKDHLVKDSETYYLKIRDYFNDRRFSAAQAARFLYLNRAGFNGIFRVNQNGKYNVPYGQKSPPPSPGRGELRTASKSLQNAQIFDLPFNDLFEEIQPKENDFIYFDPPYPPLNEETAYFTHYTDQKFYWTDHEALATQAGELAELGCNVMISNSDTAEVRAIYNSTIWTKNKLPVTRWIAANGNRKRVDELIITNY